MFENLRKKGAVLGENDITLLEYVSTVEKDEEKIENGPGE